jgi:hypothetical protein
MSRPVPENQRVKNKTRLAVDKRHRARRGPPKQRLDGTFKKSRRGKYNQQGRHIDGKWFASGAEGDRYEQLKEMVEQGRIDQLELQPSFRCEVKGHTITTYRADFRYRKLEAGKFPRTIIEDVKGMVTKDYIIKKKLVEALFAITVLEVPGKAVKRSRFMTADELQTA